MPRNYLLNSSNPLSNQTNYYELDDENLSLKIDCLREEMYYLNMKADRIDDIENEIRSIKDQLNAFAKSFNMTSFLLLNCVNNLMDLLQNRTNLLNIEQLLTNQFNDNSNDPTDEN